MIYCRIVALQKYKNREDLNKCVEWLSLSLRENEHNSKTIENFLEEARDRKNKSDFYTLCTYLFHHEKIVDKRHREYLLGKLFNNKFRSLK